MQNNRIQGYLDRFQGLAREFWGEVTGNEQLFTEGLRQRRIGRLESEFNMDYNDAGQEVDQLNS